MITSGLVSHLRSQPAVSALVGENIQPIPATMDDSYPLITYQVISDIPQAYTLTGSANVSQIRIAFDCLADESCSDPYLVSHQIADAIKTALSGLTATTLPDGTYLFQSRVVGQFDGYNEDGKLSHTTVHVSFLYASAY